MSLVCFSAQRVPPPIRWIASFPSGYPPGTSLNSAFNFLTGGLTHRQFLKMCGLAVLGAGASQVVAPPTPTYADYPINDNLVVTGSGDGFISLSGANPSLRFSRSTGTSWHIVNESDAIRFYTGSYGTGIQRLKIDSAGNVSLTAVGNKLYLNGSTDQYLGGGRWDDVSLVNNRVCWMRIGSAGGLALWGGAGVDSDDSPHVRIKTNGNVGIGTIEPSAKLDVVGTVKMTGLQLGTSATAGYVLTADASGVGTWQAATGGGGSSLPPGTAGQTLRHDGTNWVANSTLFNNNGRVGVGTQSPRNGFELAVLDSNFVTSLRVGGIVSGYPNYNIGAELSRHQVIFSSWNEAAFDTIGAKIVAINRFAGFAPIKYQNTDLAFFTLGICPGGSDSTEERVRITSSGNLGIGTVAPSERLEVAGNIRVDGELFVNGVRAIKSDGVAVQSYYAA